MTLTLATGCYSFDAMPMCSRSNSAAVAEHLLSSRVKGGYLDGATFFGRSGFLGGRDFEVIPSLLNR